MGKQHEVYVGIDFFSALICVLSFWLAFNPLLFPPISQVLEEELKMNKCSSSELIEQYFLEKISQQVT